MAVRVQTGGDTFQSSAPTALFSTRMFTQSVFTDYDVTRDGQRFVIGTLLDAPNAIRPIAIVVLNWTADLK